MINREAFLQELQALSKNIQGPFPYPDLRKMRKTGGLASHFRLLRDNDWLSADLNTYCMAIHGLASRLLQGNVEDAPTTALYWLANGDFFALFPKYAFLADEWEKFSRFAHFY